MIGFSAFLAERELDAEVLDAANRSFDIYRRHVVTSIRNEWKRLFRLVRIGSPTRKEYLPKPVSPSGLTKREKSAAAERLVMQYAPKGLEWPHFGERLQEFETEVLVNVNSRMTDPSFLVIPSFIKDETMGRATDTKEIRVSIKRIPNLGGTYRTARKSVHEPRFVRKGRKKKGFSFIPGGADVAWRRRYAKPDSLDNPTINLSSSQFTFGFSHWFHRLAYALLFYAKTNSEGAAEMESAMQKVEKIIDSTRGTYVHEYVHLLDDMRYRGSHEAINITKGTVTGHSKELPQDPYYRSDIEWNAHFQDRIGIARDMVRSYLVAATSDLTARNALRELAARTSNRAEAEASFNANPKERNRLVAQTLERSLDSKLERLSKEEGFYPDLKAVFRGSKWSDLLHRVFVYKHAAMSSWMTDERIKRKFISRVYSATQDIERMTKDYLDRVRSGKVPTKEEWSAARDKMFTDQYNIMYDGIFMRSSALEPYSPRKKYSLEGI